MYYIHNLNIKFDINSAWEVRIFSARARCEKSAAGGRRARSRFCARAVDRGEGGKQDGGSLEAAAAVKNRCEKINERRVEQQQKGEFPSAIESCWWSQPQVGEFDELFLCQRWVLAAANRCRSNTLISIDTNSRLALKLPLTHLKSHMWTSDDVCGFVSSCGLWSIIRVTWSDDRIDHQTSHFTVRCFILFVSPHLRDFSAVRVWIVCLSLSGLILSPDQNSTVPSDGNTVVFYGYHGQMSLFTWDFDRCYGSL